MKTETPIADAFAKWVAVASKEDRQQFCDNANSYSDMLRGHSEKSPKKPVLYTSGSIEYAEDPFWWRKKIKKAVGKKYTVIIPRSMTSKYKKDDPRYRTWVKKTFVMPDFNEISACDCFFIQICKTTFKGMGTPSELSFAAWLGKPIVAWIDGVKLNDMPGWTLGCLDGAKLCSSLEEAIDHYKKLSLVEHWFRSPKTLRPGWTVSEE